MPQELSSILEPNTSKILDRIKSVDRCIDKGYDVHLNFSPVIVTDDSYLMYKNLFELCDKYIQNKDRVFSEVIFLTHNEKLHQYNIKNGVEGEELLWKPEIQEPKISQYGGKNIRYKHTIKRTYVDKFRALHDQIIPWNTIRYCF